MLKSELSRIKKLWANFYAITGQTITRPNGGSGPKGTAAKRESGNGLTEIKSQPISHTSGIRLVLAIGMKNVSASTAQRMGMKINFAQWIALTHWNLFAKDITVKRVLFNVISLISRTHLISQNFDQ